MTAIRIESDRRHRGGARYAGALFPCPIREEGHNISYLSLSHVLCALIINKDESWPLTDIGTLAKKLL